MNIKDIDLQKLSDKLINNNDITDDEIELINRIFFSCISNIIPKADIIIVLGGSACLDRIERGIEVMKQSGARYIIPTGGVTHSPGTPTEATRMYACCIENGVAAENIILENQATTTRENILFSSILVSRLKLVEPKIIIVSSASHIRRVQMCCDKINDIFPDDSKIYYSYSIPDTCRPDDWHTNERGKTIIGRELQLLHRYLYKYDCKSFEI